MGSGHLWDETSRNAPQGTGFGSEAGFGLTLEDWDSGRRFGPTSADSIAMSASAQDAQVCSLLQEKIFEELSIYDKGYKHR